MDILLNVSKKITGDLSRPEKPSKLLEETLKLSSEKDVK